VADDFAGKEILIGEFGWPSAGRMREAALPSPVTQARVLTEVLKRSRQDGFHVNLIEAFDQPWKRYLEGTVGGHWGLHDDATRQPKFQWGAPVSNHPNWMWQALGGVALAAVVFGAAVFAERRFRKAERPSDQAWIAIAVSAVAGGVFAGWTIENVPIESLGMWAWIRALAFAAVAIGAPIATAAALTSSRAVPAFNQVIGAQRARDALSLTLGVLFIALTLLAVQSALALSFDPRYRDFPFAPMTAAAVPFLLTSLVGPRSAGARPLAEMLSAGVLVLCAAFIVWNETLANWQALWFAAMLVALVVSLLRVRAAPG
jgi:glucan 1,3-beta-glucosidase